MGFRYNMEKLKQIIDNLSVLTGISMAFLNADDQYLYKKTREDDFCAVLQCSDELNEKCNCSDRELLKKCRRSRRYESHFCHAGLYDACMPVLKDQALAGFVMLGQIRMKKMDEHGFAPEDEALAERYRQVPCMTEEQMVSLQKLLPEILFQNAIQFDDFMSSIIEYVKKHLGEKLSLGAICAEFHVSKNYLYLLFRESYQCTVNEYILRLRLEKARALLLETRDPVYLIAESVGIDNYSYFCRLFKNRCGLSPTAYRKQGAQSG